MNILKTCLSSMLLCLVCTATHAATFCVTTGTQLYNNLNTAAGNGQDDIIRIVQGTLNGGNPDAFESLWQYYAASSDNATGLNVSGGWNVGCTSQVQNPELSVLDANYTGAGLQFSNTSGDPLTGVFVVRNLTITRGKAEFNGQSAAFQWVVDGTAGNSILLENVLVVASQSAAAS